MLEVGKAITRDKILRLQETMLALPASEHVHCPVEHFFDDDLGIYGRGLLLPKGTIIVGKIHLHAHWNRVHSGHCVVATEFGIKELRGPIEFMSEPGTKRAVLAIEDTVWITYHENPSRTRDLVQLETEIIAPSYLALDHHNGRLTA